MHAIVRALRVGAVAVLLGVLVGVAFVAFEWLVKHGTPFIWNDLFQSDRTRWAVVPLAIGLSIVYSSLFRYFRTPRVAELELSFLDGGLKVPTTHLWDIFRIFSIGLTSLLAGASLGPEAPLIALSIGLAAWLSVRTREGERKELLAVSAIGALLIDFFGSLVPIVVPLLLLLKKGRLRIATAVPSLLTGLAAYGTLIVLTGGSEGFGTVPTPSGLAGHDYIAAWLLGLLTAIAAWTLRRSVVRMYAVTVRWSRSFPWILGAGVFGLVLGMLYLVGGETVQFNGSTGSVELFRDRAQYGAGALLGLVVIKTLATAWSLSSGYRGGLVFPSIYLGVALGLLVSVLFPALAGPGLIIGSVGGIVAAMTSPALAAVMLLAIVPLKLFGVVVAGLAGAVLAGRFLPPVQVPAKPPQGARSAAR